MSDEVIGALDFQLLAELRINMLLERMMPFSLFRILEVRGWVCAPRAATVMRVESVERDELGRMPECDCTLVDFKLTRAGAREVERFQHILSDSDLLDKFVDEDEDEEDERDEDEDEEDGAYQNYDEGD